MKKILSILLTLTLLLGLFPVTAMADGGPATEIWVGATNVVNGDNVTYWLNGSDGGIDSTSADEENYNVKFDPNGGKPTLTLREASIMKSYTVPSGVFIGSKYGIYSNVELELVPVGDNNRVIAEDAASVSCVGIYVSPGNLTISGSGGLTAYGGKGSFSYGIFIGDGDLLVKGGKLEAVGGDNATQKSCGIELLGKGHLIIKNGAQVTASGGSGNTPTSWPSYGVMSTNSTGKVIVESGGKLSASGGQSNSSYSFGIQSTGLEINGELTAIGGSAKWSYGIRGENITIGGDAIVNAVGSTATTSCGISVGNSPSSAINISGGTVTAYAQSYAIDVPPNVSAYDNIQITASNNYTGTPSTSYESLSISSYKYLKFEPLATCHLTVNLNGGNGGTTGGDYAAGTVVSINAGIKPGYTFSGWTSTHGSPFADASNPSTTFTMPPNDTTITANWVLNSGGGSGGNSGGGPTIDNTPIIIVTPPAPDRPDSPTQGEIKVTGTRDGKGNMNVNITDKTVNDVFNKALADAKKNGDDQNGITVVLRVDAGNKATSNITVNLPKTVQDTIISKKIVNTVVVVDNPDIRIGMDLETVTEINSQANSDVNISATPIGSHNFSDEAKTAIGNRPTFDLKVNYSGDKKVESFGKGKVAVTIPYTLSDNENAENLMAVYVDENGQIHWLMNSVYDKEKKVLHFITDHFSTYAVGYKETDMAFNDIEGHWAKNDIGFAANRNLFSGTSATSFSPDKAMTRGMFVTVLGRLAGTDTSGYKNSSFADVKSNTYYMGYIEWASKEGIVSGIGNNKFAPDTPITREEMATILKNYIEVNHLTLAKVNVDKTFTDGDKISDYAAGAVRRMRETGLISGKSSNIFDPKGYASRAEVSSVIRRLVESIYND